MDNPGRLRAERLAASRPLFYEPGTATDRALGLLYSLLDLPPHHVREMSASPLGASL